MMGLNRGGSAMAVSLACFGPLAILCPSAVVADETGAGFIARGAFYYTDDVAIFSATRRLSLNADPTQPALDDALMGQGADGVFEAGLAWSHSFQNDFGTTEIKALGDGFIFMEKTAFTHGTLRLQAQHAFNSDTALLFIYYYSPDLYLGENQVRQPVPFASTQEPVDGPIANEVVSSNIMTLRLDQALTDTLQLHILGRYGLRRYDPKFAERNLNLWTVGPHLEWKVLPTLKWLIGYHFERGLASGHYQPWLVDDVSYDNNFVSTELEYEFTERYQLNLGLHYELNNWLSQQVLDPRYGTREHVYQGELFLTHDLTEITRLFAGVQYSNRAINTDTSAINNINVSLGAQVKF